MTPAKTPDIDPDLVIAAKTNKKALERLTSLMLPMLQRYARRYARRTHMQLSEADCLSLAWEGMQQAVGHYDPALSAGAKFTTYAARRMWGNLQDYVRSVTVGESRSAVAATNAQLARIEELVRERRGVQDIAREVFGDDERGALRVRYALLARAKRFMVSLDAPRRSDSETGNRKNVRWAEQIPAPRAYEPFEHVEAADTLASLLAALTARERYIFVRLHLDDDEPTMKRIGTEMGLSESRVCQLHCKLAQKVRARFAELERAA